MGCAEGRAPRKFTLSELTDLPIGGKREMASGCGPSISGAQGGSGYSKLLGKGFGWPANNEFAWGGLGSSCTMNGWTWKYGCEAGSGVGGRRGTVSRVGYRGDPASCCRAQSRTIGNNTCNPKYTDNFAGAACDVHMDAYCKGSTLGSTICQRWVNEALTKERSLPNSNLKNYCSIDKNFANSTCQKWCDKTRHINSMNGACDQVVASYCKKYPEDDRCKCIAPPKNITRVQTMIPSSKTCWYTPCKNLSNDNFITSSMRNQKKNCATTVCNVEAGDITVSGDNNEVSFKNECVTTLLKPGARAEIKEREAMARAEVVLKEKEEAARVAEAAATLAHKETTSSRVKYMSIILLIIGMILALFSVPFLGSNNLKAVGLLGGGAITSLFAIYMFIRAKAAQSSLDA